MDEKKQGGLGAPSGYSAGSEGTPGRDLSDDERRRFESGYSAMSEPSDIGGEPRAASAPITEPIDIDIRTHPTGTVMASPAEGPREPKGDGTIAKRAVDRVAETAQHGADTAREVAKQRAEQGKEKVADRIEEMSSKVEEQISDKAAEYVGTVTGMVKPYMQNAAETLRTKSTDELMQMGRDQIRERPLSFAAGAFALGFIGTRFLKA
jgi:hypothetical protein